MQYIIKNYTGDEPGINLNKLSNTEDEAAVSMTDSTFSWDSEETERATLRK